jgi:hypothetical protein
VLTITYIPFWTDGQKQGGIAMKTLPLVCSDNDIKLSVVEWSELLSRLQYLDALNPFPHVPSEGWTPELLEATINGYGVPDQDEEVAKDMLKEWGVEKFVITSLMNRIDYTDVINNSIDVERKRSFGLDPLRYCGMVHYSGVPLSGY